MAKRHRGCSIERDRLEPRVGIAGGRTGKGRPIAEFQAVPILSDHRFGPGAFGARDKGTRPRVGSGAVMNLNVVEACRRLALAHLNRPGLADIGRCPVQNFGSVGLPNLHPMGHTDFRKSMCRLIS